ncbi:hypothetical protein U5A82_09160 [Sphingobium sp. CR2-8]|uniref:hypothetical protein n=1 Tax=Sphingobium sp. CR2-8 TaxID=1306534 RepID=UPI002DB89581|nr:hypothetical protein [Sphingobium sp. CR2-8]MEC3910641.1 hypothetical protein [Sphingobium sp. CR2-8]
MSAQINMPFALSLSKPVLSDCRRQAVEGGLPSFEQEQGFDKLSPNGVEFTLSTRRLAQ